jgi:hypothetical protein
LRQMDSRFLNSAVPISPDLIELAPDGLQISELCPSCPCKPY